MRRNTVIVEACVMIGGVLGENERDKNGHGNEKEEDYDDRE